MSDETLRPRVAATWLAHRNAPTDPLEEWVRDLPSQHELENHHTAERTSEGLIWMEPEVDPLPERPSADRHHTGLCFEVESTEMRAACVEPIGTLLEADAVVHEVRHQRNAYHTDLVYADVDPDGVAKREATFGSRAPLHEPLQRFKTWCYIYEYGPKTKTEAVENGLYSNPSKNRKHVNWLLEHGYLALSATDHLTAVVPPTIATLHAVELKLRDWETALEQAARARRCDVDRELYRSMRPEFFDRWGYADYAWVAPDAGAIGPALANAVRFREEGVGLLAIAEGGTVVKHIDAEHRPRRRYTRDRAFVESQIFQRIDVDEYLPSPGAEADGSVQRTLEAVTDGGGRP